MRKVVFTPITSSNGSTLKSKRTVKSDTVISRRAITAADEDEEMAEDDLGVDYDDTDGMMDAIDDVADSIEDIQDAVDNVEEDDVAIVKNNNIENHYIAECDTCLGVFISAVIESDQTIDHVTGTCPLCGKETDQYLKWVIRDAHSSTEETL